MTCGLPVQMRLIRRFIEVARLTSVAIHRIVLPGRELVRGISMGDIYDPAFVKGCLDRYITFSLARARTLESFAERMAAAQGFHPPLPYSRVLTSRRCPFFSLK
jgi:hypothetical protein